MLCYLCYQTFPRKSSTILPLMKKKLFVFVIFFLSPATSNVSGRQYYSKLLALNAWDRRHFRLVFFGSNYLGSFWTYHLYNMIWSFYIKCGAFMFICICTLKYNRFVRFVDMWTIGDDDGAGRILWIQFHKKRVFHIYITANTSTITSGFCW